MSPKAFMCGVCEKLFSTIGRLESHIAYVHTEVPKQKKTKTKNFQCDECGKEYKTNIKYLLHLTKHTGVKPYACDMCDATFTKLIDISRHKVEHTGEKPFKCDFCPAAFIIRSDLERHNMAHTGDKPFKCLMCDASFVRKPILEYHMNTHTGETPFKCDFYGCGAEYASPATLKSHKAKHGPPPLKTCKVCKEKFTDLNALKRHMLIHPGHKPLPCDQCDKIFYSESTLKRHLHVHMYKPDHKKNIVIKRRRNGGVKKPVKPAAPIQKRVTSEYQALAQVAAAEYGQSSLSSVTSVANSWTINAEATGHRPQNLSQTLPQNLTQSLSQTLPQNLTQSLSQTLPQNLTQTFHHTTIPASQFSNLSGWPTAMDPAELRHRLLNSFNNK